MAKKHLEIAIEVTEAALREQLIAALAEVGFDGFLEEEKTLKAYKIFEAATDQGENADPLIILEKYGLSYTLSTIEEENWNEVWEKNFDSIYIDDFVGIRANFHEPINGVEHELIITPKMSFGTGHHATTYSVIQLMRNIDFSDKSVYDFGTGTGVLAILAEKLGAQKVLAVDNDPWCIENATENIAVNNCVAVEIALTDTAQQNTSYDIVLANINRHIIEANVDALVAILSAKGQLILSGLLSSDESDIVQLFVQKRLTHLKTIEKTGWIAIHLITS